MLKKRRGLTIPVGIDAQNTQRYRDISTLVLSLIYIVKVLAKENLNSAIQVEHEGEVYSFPFYQDYIYQQFNRVGIVRNRESVTLTKDVEVGLRLSILNDLLMNTPLTMQWFGMFPDMLRVLYRSLQNIDETIFTMVSDEFIEALNSYNLELEPNQTASKSTPPKKTESNQIELKNDKVTPEITESIPRKPIKRSDKIDSLIGKLQQNPPLQNKPVVNEKLTQPPQEQINTVFSENNNSKTEVLSISPAMQALLKKKSSVEEVSVNQKVDVDFSSISKDCIRDALSKETFITFASLVNGDGEILYEECICIPVAIWKDIVRTKVMALADKKDIGKIEAVLVNERVLIKSNKGLKSLHSAGENFIALDVSKLTPSIQNDIKLLQKTLITVQVNDLAQKNE